MAINKIRRPPFFLPKMNFKETSTSKGVCQQTGIELDVRGLGGKTLAKDSALTKKGKRGGRKTRKHRDNVNSLSPGSKMEDHDIQGLSLPLIDSKSLILSSKENTSRFLDNKEKPRREFEQAFNTLLSVVERSKEQQKRTKERFQRNIIHGAQKPINEKLHPLRSSTGKAKTSSSPGL